MKEQNDRLVCTDGDYVISIKPTAIDFVIKAADVIRERTADDRRYEVVPFRGEDREILGFRWEDGKGGWVGFVFKEGPARLPDAVDPYSNEIVVPDVVDALYLCRLIVTLVGDTRK